MLSFLFSMLPVDLRGRSSRKSSHTPQTYAAVPLICTKLLCHFIRLSVDASVARLFCSPFAGAIPPS